MRSSQTIETTADWLNSESFYSDCFSDAKFSRKLINIEQLQRRQRFGTNLLNEKAEVTCMTGLVFSQAYASPGICKGNFIGE